MSCFRLPDLGEGLQEAEIVAWHAAVGDHVVADQPLVSVETEKAIVDVPSPNAGRISARFGEPGDVVKVGAPLVEIDRGESVDTGAVVGELPRAPQESPGMARAAPAVRALANTLGVELHSVNGSGPDGCVTSDDVRRAAGQVAGARDAGEWMPLRGVRKTMFRNMVRAHAAVVPATLTGDADVSHWTADCNVTGLLVRALCNACAASPALNAWFDDAKGWRRFNAQVDLAIAVDTEEGLLVPVLRDAASLSEEQIRTNVARLTDEARARRLPPTAFREPTITLSNFGTLGGRYAALVVLPPQVAILGVGRAHEAILAHNGAPAAGRLLPLSLTFDHRAVTGGEAARFLGAVVNDLEQ